MDTNNRGDTINDETTSPFVDKYSLIKELEAHRQLCDEIASEIKDGQPAGYTIGMVRGRASAYRKIMSQVLNGKHDFDIGQVKEDEGYDKV